MGGLGARSNVVTKEYFNWHPFLMATAFLLFMAPAVVSFEMYPLARHTNKNIHSTLMLGALIAAFAGLAIILDCHNNLTSTGSFLTLHGSVGLFTLIVLALNVCSISTLIFVAQFRHFCFLFFVFCFFFYFFE